jgi:hypothetical protein
MIGDWHHGTPILERIRVKMCEWTHKHRLQRYWSSRARGRAPWVPPHARPCTIADVEFYSLKLIRHLCNVTCRPLTLWPSDRYPRWAGREAWVTCGDGRTREMPANAAKGSTPLLTLLPRHYHARIVKHYAS